ncbi:MAG: hypothetical protein N2043_01650 [Ignavibacterium sp.]|nr:hypothetical protein [Ignavibacterium sp.]
MIFYQIFNKDYTRYEILIYSYELDKSYFGYKNMYIVSVPNFYFSVSTHNPHNLEYKMIEKGLSEKDAKNIQEFISNVLKEKGENVSNG